MFVIIKNKITLEADTKEIAFFYSDSHDWNKGSSCFRVNFKITATQQTKTIKL